mmetsp:Transcript_2638/g.7879  ORF Transcript_2638/g.7879 Transcript_2638/m.7879 type:complete len:307 (-) Transcript_2638:612-1532(-)
MKFNLFASANSIPVKLFLDVFRHLFLSFLSVLFLDFGLPLLLRHAFWLVAIEDRLAFTAVLRPFRFVFSVCLGGFCELGRLWLRKTLFVGQVFSSAWFHQQPGIQHLIAALVLLNLAFQFGTICELTQVAGDPRVHPNLFVVLLLFTDVSIEKRVQCLLIHAWFERLASHGHGGSNHELEEAFGRDGITLYPFAEEVVHVDAVPLQEIKSLGMIPFHGLRHVDDDQFSLVQEHVVLGQIAMHQLAFLHDQPHEPYAIPVHSKPVLGAESVHVVQAWRGVSILAYEIHHQHVLSHLNDVGTPHTSGV